MMIGALSALLISVVDPNAGTSSAFSEKIEARVGNKIITSSDLDGMVQALKQAAQNQPQELVRKKALETLIDRSLINIYLTQLGAPIADREVDQRINAIKFQNGITSQEDFRNLLQKQGLSFEAFRDQIRSQMEYMQFVNFMRRDSNQSIEEKELRALFQQRAKDFASNYEIELQECSIPLTRDSAEVDQIISRFTTSPQKFDECVATISQSPSASASGGKIGKFKIGMLRDDIERVVFDAPKGAVVVVRQPGAVQLIKILDRVDVGPQSFESAKDRLKARLQEERLQKEIEKKLTELRNSTYIQI
jgi:parvulin-like peptidyl-prolyl isomerase